MIVAPPGKPPPSRALSGTTSATSKRAGPSDPTALQTYRMEESATEA